MQADLFGNKNKTNRECSLELIEKIKGLKLHFDFINKMEEAELLRFIDNSKWLNDLTRRVQHYGYKYDYKARKINNSFFLGELPVWLKTLAQNIYERKLIDFIPDQAIINEYESGQGISPHIDCEPCFGDTIISLSLGSTCVMNFEKEPNSKNKIEVFVEPRTLLIMKNESRFNYYHGIPQRKSDKYNNDTFKRDRRVSITFRKVILD